MTSQGNDDAHGQAIETPHDNDILSGRGNFVNYHPGNEQFRALVRKHKVAYVACPKSMKGTFAEMIVEEVKRFNPPGRFLKQDDATKLWFDIGEKKALDKTRQALREGAPEIQKEIVGDEVAMIPAAAKIETERGIGDGNIDISSQGMQRSQERRVSDFVMNPPYNFINDTPTFVTSNGESYHLGAVQMQHQQQQQQPTSMHSPMLSQLRQQDDSDPYCSSLPSEHYENFKMLMTNNTNHSPNNNHSMNMNVYNPALAMLSENNNYETSNKEINYFPTFGNQATSLMTINEANGLGGMGSYPQNQQYNALNSQSIGMSAQNEFILAQPIVSSDQMMKSIGYGMPHVQPTTLLANGQYRQNQSINANNRTQNVRPQPIQLGSSGQVGPATTTVSRPMNGVPEKASSLKKSKDVPQVAPKSILRSVTPRRMIINVQHPISRSITPRRMDTTVPEVALLRGSPPRTSRSRLRGRREDSTKSMASTNSIAFDTLFAEFADDGTSSYKSKNTNSGASFLSVMSLSIGDVMSPVDEQDSDSQGLLLASSENISGAQSIETITVSSVPVKRVPPRRNGSNDIMNLERGVYEMSVNTISIDESEAASSQDDMSFFNVFEDQSR